MEERRLRDIKLGSQVGQRKVSRTFIDLFAGCGGFSLGMERAGFKCLAAIDFNEQAIAVFRRNFPEVPLALHKDLTDFPPNELAELLVNEEVDVIVGGPPCQGFSRVRQRDGANSGPRMVEDTRRTLIVRPSTPSDNASSLVAALLTLKGRV